MSHRRAMATISEREMNTRLRLRWMPAAAQLYRQVLERDPDNPDALHLLGVLHHQLGDHGNAVALIRRAMARRPSAATMYVNLAEAYRALGDHERAAACCRLALRL